MVFHSQWKWIQGHLASSSAPMYSISFRSDFSNRPALTAPSTHYITGGVSIVGLAHVKVSYQGQRAQLQPPVVDQAGLSLLGRDWLHAIGLGWQLLFHEANDGSLLTDSMSLLGRLKNTELSFQMCSAPYWDAISPGRFHFKWIDQHLRSSLSTVRRLSH